MNGGEREEFDELLTDESVASGARRPPRRGWLLACMGSVAAGALVLAGAALALSLPSGPPPAASVELTTATPVAPAPTVKPTVPHARAGVTSLVDERAASELAALTGIPLRALRAYLGATLQVAEESPHCGLGWNTLAGIGSVESDHGTFGGSHIGDDGATSPAIIGVALDGGDTAAIRDTDDGALDGDDQWDRAVGPMQFIPETWAAWGTDGSGDGVADPQHIDDSALAAGRYLCAAGGDLTEPQGWITAVAAYNDAVEYNNRVAAAATAYANAG